MSLKDIIKHANLALVTPAPKKKPEVVKIAVMKSMALRISFGAAVAARFGAKVERLQVRCGETPDGAAIITLSPTPLSDKGGHPIESFGRDGVAKRVVINDHPFDPGVTHGGYEVEHEWNGATLIIKCPDWDEILGEALAAQVAESDE